MQKRSSKVSGDRLKCLVDAKHAVHHHGHYERKTVSVRIARFLCYVCQRTMSVLMATLLPYRAVSVAQVERAFDARAAGRPPPPVNEIEKGCLDRAWTRFTERVPALTAALGQMVTAVKPTAATLWLELRRQSNLGEILHRLSRNFHTSLLGDYACLKPWPARDR